MGNKAASGHKDEKEIAPHDNIPIDKSESFTEQNIVKKDITAADLYYRNTLALIKLRKNKRLANVPNGVFRCILEYQFPKL